MNSNLYQTIFDGCVDLLNWTAELFGCTYVEINVIVFCFLGPLLFLALVADNVRLRFKLRTSTSIEVSKSTKKGFLLIVMALIIAPFAGNCQRVAWVVGNSDYLEGELANPVNDAILVKDSLEALGFQVRLDLNLESAQAFGQAAQDCLSGIDGAEVFLFYYAGHGIQIDNENYLIPTKALPQDEFGAKRECFAITELIARYQRAYESTPFVAVLDACRVNPFERKWSRSYGSGAGLGKVAAQPTGTLFAFSTEYGTTAADGKGDHSEYAVAFARAIGTPGLSIQQSFQEVRRLVLESTNDTQVPVEQNKLTAQLVLRQLPDVTELEFRKILDDFEEVLIEGFYENASFEGDSLIGVEQKFELVRYYASQIDNGPQDLRARWVSLDLLNTLYMVQKDRELDESTLEFLDSRIKDAEAAADPLVLAVAKDFILLLSCDFYGVSEQEFLEMEFSEPLLRFSASYYNKEFELPEIQLPPSKTETGPYRQIIEALVSTEFVETFEAMIMRDDLLDRTDRWSAKTIQSYLNLHRSFVESHMDDFNQVYSYVLHYIAVAEELTLNQHQKSKERQRMFQIYCDSFSQVILKRVLAGELDIKRRTSEVATYQSVAITYFNDMLENDVVSLNDEDEVLLANFYRRELDWALTNCSSSYVSFFNDGERLQSLGCQSLNDILPNKDVFANQILSNWDCFVANFIDDEGSDLDVSLDKFLQRTWVLVNESFEEVDISEKNWNSLSERHLQLLRLSNKGATETFIYTATRHAAQTAGSWDSELLLDYAQEVWTQIGSASSAVFHALGREEGEYEFMLAQLQIPIGAIRLEGLNCNSILEASDFCENLLSRHLEVYNQAGTSSISRFTAIPDLLLNLVDLQLEGTTSERCSGLQWSDLFKSQQVYSEVSQSFLSNMNGREYLNDRDVLELIEEEYIDNEDYYTWLQFLIMRWRLFEGGGLNSVNSKLYVEALLDKARELGKGDTRAEFEYGLINLFYDLVEEASEDIAVGRRNDETSLANVELALNALIELSKDGRDKENRSYAALMHTQALQRFYHLSDERSGGTQILIDAANAARKKASDPADQAFYDYILAEEYSCMSDFEQSIPLWRKCLSDTMSFDSADRIQFAQDLFVDRLIHETASEDVYLELAGLSNEVPDVFEPAEWLETFDNHGALKLKCPKEACYPIISINDGDGFWGNYFLHPEGDWRVHRDSLRLGFVSDRRDSTYQFCQQQNFGQTKTSEWRKEDSIDFYVSRTPQLDFDEVRILLPFKWSKLEESEVRAGYYWTEFEPTGHTQDLVYSTFLRDVKMIR